MSKTSFRVGITSDFESNAKGLLEPALAAVLDPVPGIEHEVMPDTGGVGAPEVLDRYDAVIALDYGFPEKSFVGLERLAVLARWGVGYDKVDLSPRTEAGLQLAITVSVKTWTRGMFGARDWALVMRPAFLVNAGRGAVVDEAARVEALRQRKTAGAGLAVFATEPIPDDHPLLELDNVLLSPHL